MKFPTRSKMLELKIDNLHKVAQEHGLTPEEIAAHSSKIPEFLEKIKARNQGFAELPDANTDQIKEFAKAHRDRYDHFVILGIGGSALGPICLQQALTHLFRPSKLQVIDNIDPIIVKELEDVINPTKTLFIVITKSGTTPEILALYEYFKGKSSNFVFITDPHKGDLREDANKNGIPAFDIPENVGGRFSVLSSVGLLPAALLNLDIDALQDGARVQRDKFLSLTDNPAFTLATIQYLLYQKGKSINVLMPYAQKLIRLADWYRQLLAESIGKKLDNQGKIVNVGITPINALGVTDQHSQSQLYNEGPNDKLIIFLKTADFRAKIPALDTLMQVELEATADSLTKNDRPNLTIQIPSITEETLGELFMFFEASIAFLGEFFNINAFDQPGVELSKQLTREKLSNS